MSGLEGDSAAPNGGNEEDPMNEGGETPEMTASASPAPEEVQRKHMFFLVHGLDGDPKAFEPHRQQMLARFGTTVDVHLCTCNMPSEELTRDGIANGGSRVASEVRRVVAERRAAGQEVLSLSFWGNSLGGLFARYAVAVLSEPEEPPPEEAVDAEQPGEPEAPEEAKEPPPEAAAPEAANAASEAPEEANEQREEPASGPPLLGSVPGLAFVTTACPHLGIGATFPRPLLVSGAAVGLYGQSGLELSLEDEAQLVLKMGMDDRFLGPLSLFPYKALAVNVCNDWAVDFCTAALRPQRPQWLLAAPPILEDIPEVIYDCGDWHRPASAALVEPEPPTEAPSEDVPIDDQGGEGVGVVYKRRRQVSMWDLLTGGGGLSCCTSGRVKMAPGQKSALIQAAQVARARQGAGGSEQSEDLVPMPFKLEGSREETEAVPEDPAHACSAGGAASESAAVATAGPTDAAPEAVAVASAADSGPSEADQNASSCEEEATPAADNADAPYFVGHPAEANLAVALERLAALPWRLICLRFDDHGPLTHAHHLIVHSDKWLTYFIDSVLDEPLGCSSAPPQSALASTCEGKGITESSAA